MDLTNEDDDTQLIKLQSACSGLKIIIKTSSNMESSYQKFDEKFDTIHENLNMASRRVAPLQSLSIANKALDTRINRAISPALSLLDSFKRFESLQRKLLDTASKLLNEKSSKKRLKKLIKYVDCVDKLNESVNSISQESESAIQKLQEVVEFLSRTKATDHYRTQRLRETLITLKAVHETEVDSMRFDGLLDEALLNLQDEYEGLLQKLRHENVGDQAQVDEEKSEMVVSNGLGSDLEVEVLKRISETLAANDCLDICIDIFVKVRYRRAAKALMRLNPDYLKTYTPEEIDEMQWESLETAIALWIQHFELAVKEVFVSEKNLCKQVLGNIMEGVIWPECFTKISDKIMAVFFRFGEGVARSNKEPQKLFKLLDMFDSLEKLKPEFSEIFEGESGADICSRFRELEKLLVHASSRVFWEFGLQIEGNNQEGLPPPQDGTVPKLVRYAINYLKNLSMDSYSTPMAQVLITEQIWKSGVLSNAENDQELLKDAISNVMEAIQRNTESKKLRYKDKVLAQIFAMNTYWYIYMRTRNTDLGKVLGDPYMKKRYRNVAEESAYLYQKQSWGTLVRLLDKEEVKRANNEGIGGLVRGKMEAFMVGFDEMCQSHNSSYKIVSDAGLREQIRDATIRLVVPAYKEFLNTYSSLLMQFKSYPSHESIEDVLRQIFEDGGELEKPNGPNLVRRDSGDRVSRRVFVDRSRLSRDSPRYEFSNSIDL